MRQGTRAGPWSTNGRKPWRHRLPPAARATLRGDPAYHPQNLDQKFDPVTADRPRAPLATERPAQSPPTLTDLAQAQRGSRSQQSKKRSTPHEANIENNQINMNSPIARALIGKEEGDSVEVRTPGGVKSYEILSVKFI